MTAGIVYILTNEVMPGLVKIGKTTVALANRLKGLDDTNMPLPFTCFYAAEVADCDATERRLHEAYADRRVRPRREFFRVDPTQVRAALLLAGGKEVTVDNIDKPADERAEDEKAISEARKKRGRFSFAMVGIKPGSILQSYFDPKVTCVVAENNQILFEGQQRSLSSAAMIISERYGRKKGVPLAGPDYWLYQDKSLTELRYEAEEAAAAADEVRFDAEF